MNREALFSDGTGAYRIPPEPKENEYVRIRMRAAHGDTLDVFLCTDGTRYPMGYCETDGDFDYYQTRIPLSFHKITYYFEIHEYNEICYLDRFGVSPEVRMQYAFAITPGFSTPDWAKGAVMYQILVDRFCNSDGANDVVDGEYHYITMSVKHIADWSQNPANFDVASFYGGDLQGVMDKLGDIIQNGLLNYENVINLCQEYGDSYINYGSMGMYGGMERDLEYGMMWSLNDYRTCLESTVDSNEASKNAWDELEKSIVGNIANDILVGVKGDKFEMTIICNMK